MGTLGAVVEDKSPEVVLESACVVEVSVCEVLLSSLPVVEVTASEGFIAVWGSRGAAVGGVLPDCRLFDGVRLSAVLSLAAVDSVLSCETLSCEVLSVSLDWREVVVTAPMGNRKNVIKTAVIHSAVTVIVNLFIMNLFNRYSSSLWGHICH